MEWRHADRTAPRRHRVRADERELSSFASRGQQRTAILAFKLAQLDLLTSDGQPPLLLLDDVFSELDPDRRAHLVRRIGALPQAFVTTTTTDDLDPALVAASTAWRVDRRLSWRPGRPMTDQAPPCAALVDMLPAVAELGIEDEQLRRDARSPAGSGSSGASCPPRAGATPLAESAAGADRQRHDASVAQELLLRLGRAAGRVRHPPDGVHLLELPVVIQRPADRPRR